MDSFEDHIVIYVNNKSEDELLQCISKLSGDMPVKFKNCKDHHLMLKLANTLKKSDVSYYSIQTD